MLTALKQLASLISTATPLADGTAAPGSTGQAADAGHVHPTDPTRAPLSAIAGLIYGLRLSNDATTPATVLDIAAGVATSDDGTTSIKLASAFTKTTGAWAAGTGNGGLDTGTVAASTWYHAFLISGSAGTDALFSKSATAPTMPSGYAVKRRIGSIKTNSSSQILAFNQTGDRFDWSAPVLEVNGTLGQTTAATVTLVGVPTGVVAQAILGGSVNDGTAANSVLLVSSLAQSDAAPAGANASAIAPSTSGYGALGITVVTSISGQVRLRTSSTTQSQQISTTGYLDMRGK